MSTGDSGTFGPAESLRLDRHSKEPNRFILLVRWSISLQGSKRMIIMLVRSRGACARWLKAGFLPRRLPHSLHDAASSLRHEMALIEVFGPSLTMPVIESS